MMKRSTVHKMALQRLYHAKVCRCDTKVGGAKAACAADDAKAVVA